MSKSVTMIPVIIKHIKDEEETPWGQLQRSALAIHQDHADKGKDETPDSAKFWLNFRPEEYHAIPQVGSLVNIFQAGTSKKGNPYYSIAMDSAPQQSSPPAQFPAPSSRPQTQNRATIEGLGRVYREALRISLDAYDSLGIEMDPKAIGGSASTLFIQSVGQGIKDVPQVAETSQQNGQQREDPPQDDSLYRSMRDYVAGMDPTTKSADDIRQVRDRIQARSSELTPEQARDLMRGLAEQIGQLEEVADVPF